MIMVKGSETSRINFEKETFLTRSREDFKLKAYTQSELLEYIKNVTLVKLRTRNVNKKMQLNKIIDSFAILLRMTI